MRLPVPLCLLATGGLVAAEALPVPPRPRLFLTPADLPRLRAATTDATANALGVVPAEAWQTVQARAAAFAAAEPYAYSVTIPGREGAAGTPWTYTLTDAPPPRHDDSPHYPPWTAMFQERTDSITTRLMHLAFAHLVTGDRLPYGKAREIALHLCAWPGVWTDPSYGGGKPCLDTGHAAIWVSVFYDWCWPSLTDAERQTVRTALAEKALAPIDAMIDSVPAYHNFTAVIATGLGIGGLALLGDDPRAEGWVRHALERMRLNLDAQGQEGGPLEGPMYGTYAASQLADLLLALHTAGYPHDLGRHPYLASLPRYCISLLDPGTNQQPCFGDGAPGVGFASLMRILALQGDAGAAWYGVRSDSLAPDTVRGLLTVDPARIRPVAPTGTPSACFAGVGYAVLRDGYRADSPFLAFKCGPPTAVVGHNHYDHNSFVLAFAGEWLAWDPGYREYFNPPERRYTVSTLGHNSVVLDLDAAYLANQAPTIPGHDQLTLNGGRITRFFAGDCVDYLCGTAAEPYNRPDAPVLGRFDRHVFYAKPDVFFVHDRLAGPAPHTYSFLLHASPRADIQPGPADGATVVGGRASLVCRVFCPAGVAVAAASYPGAEKRGAYLAATTGRTAAAALTAVLVPRRGGEPVANPGFEDGLRGWQTRDMPGFTANHVVDTEVRHGGRASVRIDNGGYVYSRRFSVPAGTRVTARWWARCTAAKGASSILYYWRAGKAFRHANGPAADRDAWAAYEFPDTVPEGTEEICLALQFFGTGQCWYDDVEIVADRPVPRSEPPRISALADGAGGAVAEVDGRTHVLLCGAAGERREVRVAERMIVTDAEFALLRVAPDGVTGFRIGGSSLQVNGVDVAPAAGEWQVGPGP